MNGLPLRLRLRRAFLVALILGIWAPFKIMWEQDITRQQDMLRYHGVTMTRQLRDELGQGLSIGVLSGMRSVVADLVWLQVTQAWEDEEWFRMGGLINLCTSLQPRASTFWDIGGWHLAWNASIGALMDRKEPNDLKRLKASQFWIQKGLEIYKRGIENNPEYWRLRADTGLLYQQRLAQNEARMGLKEASADHYRKAAEYYQQATELGFWDPVENASLMPWLAATALLHSVSVLASRDALRAWTVMLGVVAFSMSMVGTFLVRSGILTSVHAFAVDPQRGTFILALLAINIGGALALFTLRAGTVAEGKRFALVSREAALVFNNVMLSGILGIVLIGTLYPLVTEAYGVKVSVGAPYFNPAAALFAFPMVVVMAGGPLLRWRHDRLGGDRARRVAWPLLTCGALALAVFGWVEWAGPIGLIPAIGLALASGLFPASLLSLAGRDLRRTPLPVWGMVVAHAGIAVALFGMASESAYSVERLAALAEGDAREVGPWHVRLHAITPVAGPNWTALEATVETRYAGGATVLLHPKAETFANPPGTRNESALETRWNGQLYVVLGEQAQDGRWQMRFWWKPFVPLIWLGGALVALGGALSLLGRVLSDLRRHFARHKIAGRRSGQ